MSCQPRITLPLNVAASACEPRNPALDRSRCRSTVGNLCRASRPRRSAMLGRPPPGRRDGSEAQRYQDVFPPPPVLASQADSRASDSCGPKPAMKNLCPLTALNHSQEILHVERLRQEVIEAADVGENTVRACLVMTAYRNEQRATITRDPANGSSELPAA